MSRERRAESREPEGGTITAERGLYTCDKCKGKLPFSRFLDGGRINSQSGEWICGECNGCPDCGLSLGNGSPLSHQCRFPALAKSLGVEMSTEERRLIRWLANCLDRNEARTMAELFARSRGTLAEPVAPESSGDGVTGLLNDPWAEFDDITWETTEL